MGLLSTIGAASGRAFGLTRVGAAIRDTYFNLVTLLLPGNGTNGAQNNTFLDSSTNNFTITRNGNTTQGTFSPFSQTGWSNFFGGSSDFLNIGTGYPSALDLGSSNFTIEGWVYLQAATKQLMLGNLNDTNGTCTFFVILNNTTASARYEIKLGSTAYNLGTGTIPTNQWVHVCLMRSGTSVYLFENGSQIGTTQTYSGSITSSTNQMRVGGAIANQYPLSGYASNLRMVIGSVVYSTSGFPVPTAALTAITNTALLTCQSNRFIDSSTNAISVTTSGSPSVQAFSPFAPTAAYSAATVGGSGYFDGTGDYLTVADNAALEPVGNNFCIEISYYPTSVSGNRVLIGKRVNPSTDYGFLIFLSGATALTYISSANSSYDIANGNNIGTLVNNQWNHIAIFRVGNAWYASLNGAITTLASNNSSSVNNNAGTWAIGADSNGGTVVQGYISNVRFVIGSSVYSSTSAPFPTAPLTAITNTQLLLNFTNAGITDATAKNDLETVGNAQISTTQSKFGGSSMYFDGTGDYLSIPASDNLVMGTGDFTIECWIYLSATGTNDGVIIELRSSGATANGFVFNTRAVTSPSTGFKLNFFTDNAANLATTILAYNTWHHVAVTRSSGTVRIFANGTSDITPFTKNNNFSDKPIPTIGQSLLYTNSNITGYIDDLRITKGYARYTANFTAPTAAFFLQ